MFWGKILMSMTGSVAWVMMFLVLMIWFYLITVLTICDRLWQPVRCGGAHCNLCRLVTLLQAGFSQAFKHNNSGFSICCWLHTWCCPFANDAQLPSHEANGSGLCFIPPSLAQLPKGAHHVVNIWYMKVCTIVVPTHLLFGSEGCDNQQRMSSDGFPFASPNRLWAWPPSLMLCASDNNLCCLTAKHKPFLH